MLFNSYEFIFLFLPVTFFIYFFLNKRKLSLASKVWLIFSNLLFYSWWNIIYLPLILASVLFNYVIGVFLSKQLKPTNVSKKQLLVFGILINLSILGYFKYADFFIENINLVSGSTLSAFNLVLPLAISFFTFQQIAYLVDSYQGLVKERNLLNYITFVTFFPQLIAGPIVHHKEMMPQFSSVKNKIKNYENIAKGCFIFSIGLFKKVVIADTLFVYTSAGFNEPIALNLIEAWFTSLSYTFQLYFDFSGYSDMAIGLALLFNIKIPRNFNNPYKAKDIAEFWRRWHMTLSAFLRDYVYIPLGGSRVGRLQTYRNILTTFIIGGMWHGAGWTFILWGMSHGFALVIFRLWKRAKFSLWAWASWFLTFNFLNLTWVLFRAKDFDNAVRIYTGMFGLNEVVLPESLNIGALHFLDKYGVTFGSYINFVHVDRLDVILFIIIFLFIKLFGGSIVLIEKFKPSIFYGLLIFFASVFSFLKLSSVQQFIYFNF